MGNEHFIKKGINLPGFAKWSREDWILHYEEGNVIRELMLGWDVTDFGLQDFARYGGVLFTLRNGSIYNKDIGVPYAEKLILLMPGQALPLHFHYMKTEDIINRSGGRLQLQLYNSFPDYGIDYNSNVEVYVDSILRRIPAGEYLYLNPGEAVTLKQGIYHTFGAEEQYGNLILGEVSSVNDDKRDNHFNPPLPRYSEIEEDEEITYLLCNEYHKIIP